MTIKDFLCIAATRLLLGVLIQEVALLQVHLAEAPGRRRVGATATTWKQNIRKFGRVEYRTLISSASIRGSDHNDIMTSLFIVKYRYTSCVALTVDYIVVVGH